MSAPGPTTTDVAFGSLPARVEVEPDVDALVASLLDALSVDDRMAMMSGDLEFWPGLVQMLRGYGRTPYIAGAVDRLDLPGIRFSDGPRGVTLGQSTCFPVGMARGATWDVELEERVGAAIGAEARAQGANLVGSVCINLLYHPAWGRAQETYGEDPVHVGDLGAGAVRGLQRHVVACVKHFALNNIEDARFQVDARASDRVLHEVYLPHFRRCVDAGAGCVMSAYNSLNGEWCGHNRRLLTEILRERWGFEGFVITDWLYGIRDAEAAANAGIDVEMPFRMHFALHLPDLVANGAVPSAQVDRAATTLLRTLARAAVSTLPADPAVVAGPEHRALAREAAVRSMVLLRNEAVDGTPLLPLPGVARLAVLGPLADAVDTGDAGSSDVRPPEVVTPLAGLRAAAPEVVYDDSSDAGRAAALAATADAAVVVVGYTSADEGEYIDMARNPELFELFPPLDPTDPIASELSEVMRTAVPSPKGGDRSRLTLHEEDETLLLAVAAAQPRTVAVLVTGSAVVTEWWRGAVPAVLVSWYSGMEGGHALADLLFGRASPSGRLPCAFPRDAADLPPFDPDAHVFEYGLYHGQRHHDRAGRPPAFPLGWGLTYTSFRHHDVRVERAGLQIELHVDVENVGARDGRDVIQCYAEAPTSSVERPQRWLVGFTVAEVAAGARTTVGLTVPLTHLEHWSDDADGFVLEPTRFDLVVAPHAGATGLRAEVDLRDAGHQPATTG